MGPEGQRRASTPGSARGWLLGEERSDFSSSFHFIWAPAEDRCAFGKRRRNTAGASWLLFLEILA